MEIRELQTFLDYWESVRGRTRRVAACIPADRIEWSPAPNRWTLGDQLRHLAGIERFMYAETVAGRRTSYPGHGPELAAGRDGVFGYFERCHSEAMEVFRGLSPERLGGKCLTPAGTPITTWKWLRAMVEHEAHHRGQIYMMLSLLGVATPPLYGLSEEEVLSISSRRESK